MYSENIDCRGLWTKCNVDCVRTFEIEVWQSGTGQGCEFGNEKKQVCNPGIEDCPCNRYCVFGGSVSRLYYSKLPHGLALKLPSQNPSASPVLEVAQLSLTIGNFPMQKFPILK